MCVRERARGQRGLRAEWGTVQMQEKSSSEELWRVWSRVVKSIKFDLDLEFLCLYLANTGELWWNDDHDVQLHSQLSNDSRNFRIDRYQLIDNHSLIRHAFPLTVVPLLGSCMPERWDWWESRLNWRHHNITVSYFSSVFTNVTFFDFVSLLDAYPSDDYL